MGKFKKGKSTLDQEIPKKLIEEENKPRFKKHNYDIKEDNKDKIKEKEEEPVTQSKPSYFNRYSRKKFESRKEKEIKEEKNEPIQEEEQIRPKKESRFDRFSYKPRLKKTLNEKVNNDNDNL